MTNPIDNINILNPGLGQTWYQPQITYDWSNTFISKAEADRLHQVVADLKALAEPENAELRARVKTLEEQLAKVKEAVK